jgi:hypothetical protein
MESFEENIDFVSVSVYDTENEASNGGVAMTSKEALAAALKETGKTQAEAAVKMGWVPQQLSARLVRNSLRADEFLELMDAIGIDVVLTVRDTGAVLKSHIAGAGRRVRGMVNRVIYDTEAADALANNFYADGVNEYVDGKAMELYLDREGRYFFAEYTNWEGAKDRITPVTANDAAAFIERYGTDLHRKPKSPELEAENE